MRAVDGVDESLVHDVARAVVTRMAPAELPAFEATSRAYFADPGWAAKASRGGGGPLGFGTGEVVLLVTPVALVAVTEVTKYVVEAVAGPAVVRGGSAVVRAVRRLFHVDGGTDQAPEAPAEEASPALTDEQWARVRAIVVRVADDAGVPEGTARLLGDAVVGAGQAPDPPGRS